ncbi:DUF1707 and DUF4870 domain-containing protein [Nocardiopsis oceani]
MAVQNPQNPQRRYPWDQGTAAPQPQVRLTHADRDAVAEVLREAYSQGQLDEEEFDERLDKTMKAKVGSELAPLTTDLGVQISADGGARPAGASLTERNRFAGGTNTDGGRRTENPAEKVGAAVGHLSPYFFPVLTPLVLLLVSGNSSPYLRRQALEALNFQLFCIIGMIASALLFWLVLPILTLLGFAIGFFILPIFATAASAMGRDWKYPLTYRLIKDD